MNWYKQARIFFNRPVTFLAIPSIGKKTLRWECTTAFIFFGVALWSALTLLACFVIGRHADYWITKADNEVLLAKVALISREMDRSESALSMAKTTDHEMRALLNLSPRDSSEDYSSNVGGPTSEDSARLRKILLEGPSAINVPQWRRRISKIREESYKRLAGFQEIGWYMSNQRSLYRATPNIWPTEGQITSLFGYRFNPMSRYGGERSEFHPGIDIANRPDTLIYATADGTVRAAGWFHGYGQMILIDHGYGVSTVYGHTSKILVKVGDHVRRGQVIAYMGTTGRSTGAHLHYEVRIHDHPVNPQRFLKIRAGLKHKEGE